jgi:hypothetical protein
MEKGLGLSTPRHLVLPMTHPEEARWFARTCMCGAGNFERDRGTLGPALRPKYG